MKEKDLIWIAAGGLALVFLLRKKSTATVSPFYTQPVNANLNNTPIITQPGSQSVVLPLLTAGAGILSSILNRSGSSSAIPVTNETAQSVDQIQTPTLTQTLPDTNPTMFVDSGSNSPTGVDEFSSWEYQS